MGLPYREDIQDFGADGRWRRSYVVYTKLLDMMIDFCVIVHGYVCCAGLLHGYYVETAKQHYEVEKTANLLEGERTCDNHNLYINIDRVLVPG